MQEIWKDIPGYEGLYKVSNTGKVKSLDRYLDWHGAREGKKAFYPGKELKYRQRTFGHLSYKFVTLSKDNVQKGTGIHRLVAIAFIPNPENKPFINHLDNNGLNNNVTNLEWCTHSENMLWAQKQGRLFKAQSKGGKAGVAVNQEKLRQKIKNSVGKTFKTWLVLSEKTMYRAKKYYVMCQCIHCGYTKWVEVSRLLRLDVTDNCQKCRKRLKNK